MKKYYVLFSGVILLSAFLTSCSKDEKSDSPSPSQTSGFSVKINGQSFSTDTANFDVEDNMIEIFAAKDNFQNSMVINIDNINPGTYNFGVTTGISYQKKTGPSIFDFVFYRASNKGSLTLTSVDTANKVVGTFNCTLYNVSNANDSLVLTQGTFSLNREN